MPSFDATRCQSGLMASMVERVARTRARSLFSSRSDMVVLKVGVKVRWTKKLMMCMWDDMWQASVRMKVKVSESACRHFWSRQEVLFSLTNFGPMSCPSFLRLCGSRCRDHCGCMSST